MDNPFLTFTNVSFRYPRGSHLVLNDLSFTLQKGSFTVVIGPSGCGKSTILKICAGLLTPGAGKLAVPEKIGMVFQSGALLPWYNAVDNVAVALESNRVLSATERRHRAHAALATMGIKDLADKFPRNLSGGQRQRIGIARALVVEPQLLLLDEPFSALDPETTDMLHAELLSVWKSSGITILMVSHSLDEAIMLGERVLVMHKGTILKDTVIGLPYPRDIMSEEFVRQAVSLRRQLRKDR